MFHVKLSIIFVGRFITNGGGLNCTSPLASAQSKATVTDKNITWRIKITSAPPRTKPSCIEELESSGVIVV
jgi:hypothetical protein